MAESVQDLEPTRKAISVQLAEFDGVKKSLMRDLQNRCEKVCLSLIFPVFVNTACRLLNLRSNWTI